VRTKGKAGDRFPAVLQEFSKERQQGELSERLVRPCGVVTEILPPQLKSDQNFPFFSFPRLRRRLGGHANHQPWRGKNANIPACRTATSTRLRSVLPRQPAQRMGVRFYKPKPNFLGFEKRSGDKIEAAERGIRQPPPRRRLPPQSSAGPAPPAHWTRTFAAALFPGFGLRCRFVGGWLGPRRRRAPPGVAGLKPQAFAAWGLTDWKRAPLHGC